MTTYQIIITYNNQLYSTNISYGDLSPYYLFKRINEFLEDKALDLDINISELEILSVNLLLK
jgi:hypothetical protein